MSEDPIKQWDDCPSSRVFSMLEEELADKAKAYEAKKKEMYSCAKICDCGREYLPNECDFDMCSICYERSLGS